ncbi:hypothetical protein J4E90_008013 [Alternaria incomplexa]|uniref:uncharacterized protein n=1 Tax=Alternaria incomplexa TaxID=1187928 RepID=UPI002220D72B|nr:uncharacterized protein J4E90_008013 [Alternaria incomplexa]KAI4909316.1 hypothetical protein J4E90_008013 [Alternaria incomplexa]
MYKQLQGHEHSSEDARSVEGLVRAASTNAQRYDGSRIEGKSDTPNAKRPTYQLANDKAYHDDEFLLLARPLGPGDPVPTKKRFFTGWRMGALASATCAILVFSMNLAVTIWVWKNPDYEHEDGVGTLFQGSCSIVRESNVYIHLVVNVLSTLLLCSSNYCQQILAAPNREELRRAHARRNWLHIGVPNLRNLWHVGWDRSVLWILLFLSSVPLHLLFNSVVFTNLQANEYAVIPTTPDWVMSTQDVYDTSGFLNVSINSTEAISSTIRDQYRFDPSDAVTLRNGSTISKYRNVSTPDCLAAYGTQYVSAVGNLYLVQESPTVLRGADDWVGRRYRNDSFEWVLKTVITMEEDRKKDEYVIEAPNQELPVTSTPEVYPSNGWRCLPHSPVNCDPDDETIIPINRSAWQPFEVPVAYCTIEQVEEFCKLQFSFTIAIAVIVANFVKAVCMILLLCLYWDHGALVTIGDAIAAFLEDPDPETYGRCLHTKRDVGLRWNWNEYASITKLALSSMPKDPVKLWKTGFATVNGNNLMDFSTLLIPGVLLANTPQLVLSYLYIALNALYTSMFVSAEWASYVKTRKSLRVTSPTGFQRDSYWLNVPFRYAIPMTIMSGLFHWLASQSIFKVQISITDMHTRIVASEVSTCGYSPVAIILTTVVGFTIAAGGLIISRFWYPAGIPLASSCSAAISAACHAPLEDVNASLLPVQWGAVTHGKAGEDGDEPIGRCCFTSFPVEMPIPGRLYA